MCRDGSARVGGRLGAAHRPMPAAEVLQPGRAGVGAGVGRQAGGRGAGGCRRGPLNPEVTPRALRIGRLPILPLDRVRTRIWEEEGAGAPLVVWGSVGRGNRVGEGQGLTVAVGFGRVRSVVRQES